MFKKKLEPVVPTFETFMGTVVDRQACSKHKVPTGVPCWSVRKIDGSYAVAVCNNRAVAAGFNATVRKASFKPSHNKK